MPSPSVVCAEGRFGCGRLPDEELMAGRLTRKSTINPLCRCALASERFMNLEITTSQRARTTLIGSFVLVLLAAMLVNKEASEEIAFKAIR
jgi:hypothetical protein